LRISLIAAAATNGVIGANGALPWHLPDDFRWFKSQTLGKPVVMGRRTWESLGRPLPDRVNIVLTRDTTYIAAGAVVVHAMAAAVHAAGEAEELMVIGGGELYRAFLPLASRVYLTVVDAAVAGDTTFPALDTDEWREVSAEPHAADERHAHAFEFKVFDRP